MRDAAGRVLTVRKHGTRVFMLPGGKPELGETADATAAREFTEELGVVMSAAHLRFLGEFRAPAANEAGFDVVAAVFEHPFVSGVRVSAEIDELAWVDPGHPHVPMAPLNTDCVFPLLSGASEMSPRSAGAH